MDTCQFGAVMPIDEDGTVTSLNSGHTFTVTNLLKGMTAAPDAQESEESLDWFEFCAGLGGGDFGFPWPAADFGYTTHAAVTPDGQYLLVVVATDLPVDGYPGDEQRFGVTAPLENGGFRYFDGGDPDA